MPRKALSVGFSSSTALTHQPPNRINTLPIKTDGVAVG